MKTNPRGRNNSSAPSGETTWTSDSFNTRFVIGFGVLYHRDSDGNVTLRDARFLPNETEEDKSAVSWFMIGYDLAAKLHDLLEVFDNDTGFGASNLRRYFDELASTIHDVSTFNRYTFVNTCAADCLSRSELYGLVPRMPISTIMVDGFDFVGYVSGSNPYKNMKRYIFNKIFESTEDVAIRAYLLDTYFSNDKLVGLDREEMMV